MSIESIANQYIAKAKAGQFVEILQSLYAHDALSVEAASFDGQPRTVKGLEAMCQKSLEFERSHEIHSHTVRGPWPHGQEKFAVHMAFDMTHTQSGHRRVMDEIAVLTVREGKIIKEEFFYQG